MNNLINIRKFKPELNENYRSFIGHLVAKQARNQKIKYVKIKNENNYPKEFLEQYFLDTKITFENEDCEKITFEMIKVLPIRMFTIKYDKENLTTDGICVFCDSKLVGKWNY